MATQTQIMSGSRLARQERAAEKPPQGLIPQLIAVVVKPRFFFRVLPRGRSWIAVGILILCVVGFTSTRQISSTTRSLVSTTPTTQTIGAGRNFNRNATGQTGATTDQTTAGTSSTGTTGTTTRDTATTGTGRNFAAPADAQTSTTTSQATAAGTPTTATTTEATTGTGRNFAAPTDAQTSATTGTTTTAQTAPTGAQTGAGATTTGTTGQTAPTTAAGAQAATGTSTLGATGTTTDTTATTLTTSSTLTSALLAAGSILIVWVGQAVLLSLVPMLRGFKPQFSRGLQIAVWATVPLAIMLLLRQIYFAAGGTGGMTGLSLLLTTWNGYASLPEIAQRVLTTFMSNLSLFWVWGLLLIYFGAREALRGRRWTAIVVVAMWVTLSTVVPAMISQPVSSVAPRTTTSQTTGTTTGTTGTTRTTTTATGAAAQPQFGAGAFPAGGNFGGTTGTTRTNRGG